MARDDEDFDLIGEQEIAEADDYEREKCRREKEIEKAIEELKAEGGDEAEEAEIEEVVKELRHLEERLHLWKEVRQRTIGMDCISLELLEIKKEAVTVSGVVNYVINYIDCSFIANF